MEKSVNWYLMKINRLAAWTLLGTMFLYLVSGYGMTKGIISSSLAVNLHKNWLPLVLLGSFSIHTCFGVSMAFKRWRIWNPITRFLLLGFYLLLFFSFVYLNNFYHKPETSIKTNNTTQSPSTTPVTQTPTNNSPAATQKTFSKEELAKYNGLNGQPAYVAVSGNVYDVSQWFQNGNHFGHAAGQDLTNEFLSRHDSSLLQYITVVGTYSG